MANEAILSWEEYQEVINGQHETTDFQGTTLGFGNLLVAAIRGGQVSNKAKAYNPYRAFLARQTKDQLKLSPYQDPKAFMRALRASSKGVQAGEALTMADKTAALPIVYFQRVPSYRTVEGSDHAPVRNWARIVKPDGTPRATIHQHHVGLQYRIYVLAWETETLERITGLLSAFFRHHARKFAFRTELLDQELDASGYIVSTLLDWEDMSPGIETDRLMCLSATVEVIAEAFEAQGLDTQIKRFTLLEPRPMFDGWGGE